MNSPLVAATILVATFVVLCLRTRGRDNVVRISVGTLFAVTALTAATAVGVDSQPVAAAEVDPPPTVDPLHPYSDPVWWPLREEAKVDCTTRNPDCTNHHDFYGVDMIPVGQYADGRVPPSDDGIYAMGAGIAHYETAVGRKCDEALTSANFGTTVWIDHGAGVISRYGHLKDNTEVSEGQLVRAGQRIGTVGNTGKDANCNIAYTDFMLRPKGLGGAKLSTEFSTTAVVAPDGALFACNVDGTKQSWPGAVVRTPRWEDVPKDTVIPASTSDCMPTEVPKTPNKASSVKLAKTLNSKRQTITRVLKASWAAPSSTSKVDTVRVELSEYHPTTKQYDKQHLSRWWTTRAPATTKSVTFKYLVKGHKYRMRVWFHNATGWNAASWVYAYSP